MAYIPICNKITEIIIPNEKYLKKYNFNKKCYKDIMIDYKKNGTIRQGFLRYENIITSTSPQIDCDLIHEKELIIDNKIKVSKKNNKISISKYTSSQIKLNNRNNQLNNIFNHHKYLTNGTDAFENLDVLLTIQNENFASNNYIDFLNTKLEKEEDFKGYFYTAYKESSSLFKKLFMFLFYVLLTILFLFVIMYLVSIVYAPFKKFLILQYDKIILEFTKFKVHYNRIKAEHFRNV